MTRANRFLASENLAKPKAGCKVFHVEHAPGSGNLLKGDLSVPCGTMPIPIPAGLRICFTWNKGRS